MSDRHLRRNVKAQLAAGLFEITGYRLLNGPTFLPVYLYSLSESEFVVGLARTVEALGQMLTPMLAASLIGHRARILGIALLTSFATRLQILFIAMVGLAFAASREGIWLIVLIMAALGAFQGMSAIMMGSLRAKVIPITRLGFVSGWRNFLSGFATAILAYFAGGYFIDQNTLGSGYAALFLLAFLMTMIGLGAMAFTKEPNAVSVRERQSYLQCLRALPDLLRNNQSFARFVVVAALGTSGRMAVPFYVLYAGLQMKLTGSVLGALTAAWLLSGTVTNIIWGRIADQRGYRIVMICTLSMWALAHCQLFYVESFWGFASFFLLFGTASSGFNLARQNMVIELGAAEDTPLRMAMSNMAVNTIAAVGPLVGGAVVLAFGHEVIFIVCFVLQVVAITFMIRLVPEPRYGSGNLDHAVKRDQ